jgi:hypothetical protein
LEIRGVKEKKQNKGEEKLPKKTDLVTSFIDLDFEDVLIIGIVGSVLRPKAKRRKSTDRPRSRVSD